MGDGKSEKLTTSVTVETPEQVYLHFELAGPSPRILAYIVDFTIRSIILSIIALIVTLAFASIAPNFSIGIILVASFVMEWGYHTILEWRGDGATPGKKLLGIRVIRSDGIGIDLLRSALRNLVRAADLFPFFYASALTCMFFSDKYKRLGDYAADSIVVRTEPAIFTSLPPLPPGIEPLAPDEFRQLALSSSTLAQLDEFWRRRRLFSSNRADEIATVLADTLKDQITSRYDKPEHLLAGIVLAANANARESGAYGVLQQ